MEGIRLLAPDSESFLLLTPKCRQSSSFYLVVAVQWKPGPIVNNSYNTRCYKIRPVMSVVAAAEWGLLFTGVICWAGVVLRVTKKWDTQSYRQAHIPEAGSRKQSPGEVSRAGVLGLPTAQLQQNLLVCDCIVNDATGERARRGRCDF